jgi:hypothetical protein
MDTLTCVRRGPGGVREPAEPWVPPWPGQTAWVVTEPDWENTDIHGVASSVEAAWQIVRNLGGAPGSMIFWEQDAHTGYVIGGGTESGRPYVLVPHELQGV